MNHAYLRPLPPLDKLVDFFWATDRYDAATPRERVLPTGSAAVVVHLGGNSMRVAGADDAELSSVGGAVLCGARTSPLVLDTSLLGPTVGIHFKAGGLRPFFDIQAEEVAEQATSLEELWGSALATLRDQLQALSSNMQRARLMEQFLLGRARRPLEQRSVLRESLSAFEDPALRSVAEVNRRTGLSPKRLLALFREEVGLCPKSYWRVRRFRAALQDLDGGVMRGAPLAAQHGYCDQAHFLREFRALAGSCPSEYLAARVPGTDHVSVHLTA
jgi:AraC-like DNA-binding protein